jgi:hypothetical protein
MQVSSSTASHHELRLFITARPELIDGPEGKPDRGARFDNTAEQILLHFQLAELNQDFRLETN